MNPNNIYYTLYVADSDGNGITNLNPVSTHMFGVDTGQDQNLTLKLIFTHIGQGFYKSGVFNWGDPALTDESFLVKIDLGQDVQNIQRYRTLKIERSDVGGNYLKAIEASTTAQSSTITTINTNVSSIKLEIKRILDIEEGTWKIVNNQLLMLDKAGVQFASYDLLDSNGLATSTEPYSRVVDNISALS